MKISCLASQKKLQVCKELYVYGEEGINLLELQLLSMQPGISSFAQKRQERIVNAHALNLCQASNYRRCLSGNKIWKCRMMKPFNCTVMFSNLTSREVDLVDRMPSMPVKFPQTAAPIGPSHKKDYLLNLALCHSPGVPARETEFWEASLRVFCD